MSEREYCYILVLHLSVLVSPRQHVQLRPQGPTKIPYASYLYLDASGSNTVLLNARGSLKYTGSNGPDTWRVLTPNASQSRSSAKHAQTYYLIADHEDQEGIASGSIEERHKATVVDLYPSAHVAFLPRSFCVDGHHDKIEFLVACHSSSMIS